MDNNQAQFQQFSDTITFSKQQILEALLKKIVKVKFTKADGSITEMECTLNDALIPQNAKTAQSTSESELVIRCYSIDRQGWRSFRIDRLIELS